MGQKLDYYSISQNRYVLPVTFGYKDINPGSKDLKKNIRFTSFLLNAITARRKSLINLLTLLIP